MRRAKGKQDSLQLLIAVGAERPTERVVFVPWSRPESCWQTTGKFAFDGKDQEIRIWLPVGVILDALEIGPYNPPKVPDAATRYRPPIVPPSTRPRLWVSTESLPGIRANLTRGENAPLWATIRARAAEPFVFQVEPGREVGSQAALERAAVAKAFVFLMNRETDRGREAVELIRDYVAAVDFGNLLDITREIGRAIYSAALVYDWCYDLMSPTDRGTIRRNLMRLADDMEVGWPPFRQMIVNGHGNEAQINRDLLAYGDRWV
jgi:heparin/heparan-sulfate lyase